MQIIMILIINLAREVENKGYSQQEFINTVKSNFKELLNEKNKLESREEKRKELSIS